METWDGSKLHWACRRGMLELDVLLGNYLREAFSTAPYDLQRSFVDLLSFQDQELYLWLMGMARPTVPALVTIIDEVRRHARDRIHF